jgi:GABA permease
MPQYLVVANQTLGGERLRTMVGSLAEQDPSRFHVVVPATPPSRDTLAWMRSEKFRISPGESAAVSLARWMLRKVLLEWAVAGVEADGEVGPADPMAAVTQGLQGRPCELIIVSTFPRKLSQWLAGDLPRRLRRAYDIPVLHLEAEPALTLVR